MVGNSLVPDMPVATVVLHAFGGALIFFVIGLAATVASLQLRQLVLRTGGTDTQWFWFASEPTGLVRLRDEARIRAPDHGTHGEASERR